MQDYFQREHTFQEPNAGVKLTFVGTLLQALAFALMFFANILYSLLGVKRLLVIGAIMVSGGFILSGQATSIWQLYISLSICAGSGIAIMQTIALRLLPNWFQKYRSTAFGLQTAVIPLGGLTYPYFMVHVNNTLGPSWTFRIAGLFCCFINVCAFAIIKERRPPTNNAEERKKVFSFGVLKNVNFIIWLIIPPVQLFAQYISYTFLPLNATYLGLSDVKGASLVSIMSASNFVGRIAAGVLGDMVGGLNMYVLFMATSTISIWTVWIFASSFTGLIGFALMNGFVSGSFGSIAAAVTIAIVGSRDYPAASGIRMIPFIASIFGSLLAGYLESIHPNQPFLYAKLVAGGGAAMACLAALLLKFRMDKKLWARL